MSPTWLELAVALVLLYVAWRLGLALAPWLIARFRSRNARENRLLTNSVKEKRNAP